MFIIAQVLKGKWFENDGFCSLTNNKLVNVAANDSARVRGQDRKIPPALGTNQIAVFGGFRQLASLEKKVFLLHALDKNENIINDLSGTF